MFLDSIDNIVQNEHKELPLGSWGLLNPLRVRNPAIGDGLPVTCERRSPIQRQSAKDQSTSQIYKNRLQSLLQLS